MANPTTGAPGAPAGAESGEGPRLHRVLGLRDLVLLNVVAITGLRWWLTSAGGYGYGALVLWCLALVCFFIPSGLAVIDLTSRFPDEGGIYAWTKRAFGDGHGFISGWCLWTNNLFYFPTLLVFVAGNLVFMLGPDWKSLEQSSLFMMTASILLFWLCVGMNIVGMRYGRWLNNFGALGTWIPATLLIVLGGYALVRFGSSTPLSAGGLVPVFTLGTVNFFSQICFGFSGLELGSMMAGEIVEPRKNVPRAIIISGVIITGIYILGTGALLVALPQKDIGFLSGVAYAIAAVQHKAGLGFLAGASALLIGLGGLGGVSAWLAGSSRMPFVVGLDRYLPPAFGRLNRNGAPDVAIYVTAVVSTLLIVMSFSGARVQEAYLTLANFTIIVYFIPYLYMFAALVKLAVRPGETLPAGAIPVPGGRPGATVAGVVGLLTTAVAIVFAVFPAEGTANPFLQVAKMVGGSVVMIVLGWVLYRRGL
ncbi:MAG TPA: APC family permease, partial [Candidatus Polarisedimenticolia bacterium]|nr:APC family permease [Candidatus Polarisedimenticolia bacterium]